MSPSLHFPLRQRLLNLILNPLILSLPFQVLRSFVLALTLSLSLSSFLLSGFFSSEDHIHHPSKTFLPHLRPNDHRPRLPLYSLHPSLPPQTPRLTEIHHVPRAPASQRPARLTTNNHAPPPRRSYKLCRIANQVPPLVPRPQDSDRITDLDPDPLVDGREQVFVLEVEGIADAAVQADEIDAGGGEGEASGLERFLGGGTEGKDVVVCGEGGEAVVLGGVGEVEGAAGEEVEVWGCWKGEG